MPAWCTLRSSGFCWLPGQGLPLVSQGVLVGCGTIPPNMPLQRSLQEHQHWGLPTEHCRTPPAISTCTISTHKGEKSLRSRMVAEGYLCKNTAHFKVAGYQVQWLTNAKHRLLNCAETWAMSFAHRPQQHGWNIEVSLVYNGTELLIFNPGGILSMGWKLKEKKACCNIASRQPPADLILWGKTQASLPACTNMLVCLWRHIHQKSRRKIRASAAEVMNIFDNVWWPGFTALLQILPQC